MLFHLDGLLLHYQKAYILFSTILNINLRKRAIESNVRSEQSTSRSPIPAQRIKLTSSPQNSDSHRSFSPSPSTRSRSPIPTSAKVIIENLTKNVTKDHITEIFGVYGPIREVSMPIDQALRIHKGYAYILYEKPDDADDAIAHMHEGQLDGQIIDVSIVLPRRASSNYPSSPPGLARQSYRPHSPRFRGRYSISPRRRRGRNRFRGDSFRPGGRRVSSPYNSYRNLEPGTNDSYSNSSRYDRSPSRSPSPQYRRSPSSRYHKSQSPGYKRSPSPRYRRRSSPAISFRRSLSP